MKLGFFLLLIFFLTPGGETRVLSAFDNVLIITVDTLRADSLSCYGSKTIKTPNIDSLAKVGVVFSNTVSSTPMTLPSHVSLFTGLTPPLHGVQDNGGFYLDKKIPTLAEAFQGQGFHTAAFVGAFPLDSRFGLDKGFDSYDDSYPVVNNVNELTMPERKASEVADSLLKWLQSEVSNRWFAWAHFYDPHFPYNPPDKFLRLYSGNPYGGEIAYVDEQVGRILKFLKDHNLDKKTLIVLTSDHGESLGEHKEETHGIFAYESTLRIPLIFAPLNPEVISRRVRLIDIAPTVLELKKLSFLKKVSGESLVGLWKARAAAHSPPADSYFEALTMHFNNGAAPLRGIYSGNQKYIDLPIPELYDLEKDPKETSNLCVKSDSCSGWAARFASMTKQFLRPSAAPVPMDSETIEKLRALGYMAGGTTKAKKNYGPEDDPKRLIRFHNRVDAALGFYNRGLDLKALEILEKIIEEKPDYSTAYEHASFIQSEMGFPDRAVALLRKEMNQGISSPDIEARLGLYLIHAGQHEEAIERLKKVVKADSKDLDHLNYLGMAYTATGKFQEAENTFRTALRLNPADGMTLSNLGTLYLTFNKLELAEEKFKTSIEVNPHVTSAFNGLGVIYAKKENWAKAIHYWSLALQHDEKNYDAMLNLAYAYLKKDQREKALELFRGFEKNAPPARYGSDLSKVRSVIQRLQ